MNERNETASLEGLQVPAVAESNLFLLQELAARHRVIQSQAKSLVAQEMKLRLRIVSMLFPEPKVGTNTALFPAQGLQAKAKVTGYVKIDDDANIADIVDTIANNTGLLKAKYEMSEAKYRALSDEDKAKLKDNVTWKASAPALEFEGELPEPKTRGMFVNAGLIWSSPLNRYLTLEEGSQLAATLKMEYAELLSVLDSIQ